MNQFILKSALVTFIGLCLSLSHLAQASTVKVNCITPKGSFTSYFEATKAGVGDKTGQIFVQGRRYWIGDNQPEYKGCKVCEQAMIAEEKLDDYRNLPCEQRVLDVRLYAKNEILTCNSGSTLEFTNEHLGKPIRLGKYNACDGFQSPVR